MLAAQIGGNSKEACRTRPQAADYTIEQRWRDYTPDEHGRWERLYKRALETLQGRACTAFLDSVTSLRLPHDRIPDMDELSDRLASMTGWRVVPVAGLVPDEVFFDHLANRRFPAGAFIRSEREMDYLEEPDIFHDIFGHAPLLADPVFADFMQAYGKGGQRAAHLDSLKHLARLYWYTVEFGLVREGGELRIFGAGILSSAGESVFSLEDVSPHRIGFDLERVMRTGYVIDDYQKNYFVIESFEDLLAQCRQNFAPLYARLHALPDLAPGELVLEDDVITRGTLRYFHERRASA